MSTGCPVRHLTFDMSPSELTPFSNPGCWLPASQAQPVIPSDKAAFPWAWGAITWATSRVEPRPLFVLLLWVTSVPALPCPGGQARGNSTWSHIRSVPPEEEEESPVQTARWASKPSPPAPTISLASQLVLSDLLPHSCQESSQRQRSQSTPGRPR